MAYLFTGICIIIVMYLILCTILTLLMGKQTAYKRNNNPCTFICCFIFFIILCLSASLKAQVTGDTLHITSTQYDITHHLFVYETNKKLSPQYVLDSVKKDSFKQLFPAKTYNDVKSPSDFYWLVITIQNNLSGEETFYYQLNHPQIFRVLAWQKRGDSLSYMGKSGYAYAFSEKLYHYYDNVFPIVIDKGQAVTVLLQLDISNGHNPFFAPELNTANVFKAKEEKFYTVNGLIAGIMLTAFILNIFLGIFLNEKLHYLYAVYIVCIMYEILLTQGLDRQYFYPNGKSDVSLIRYLVPCSCIVLLAYVMQKFLNQQRSNSKLKIFVDVINYTCIGITVFYCIYYLISTETTVVTGIFQKALAILAFTQFLLVFASAVEKAIQRYKPAWFYITAVLFLFWGLGEYVLMYLGVNDVAASEVKHPNDMQLGLVIETLVVFLGIVYRYNLYKREKEALLTQVNTYQASLIDNIVAAQEEERKRIAEDLHDDLGATLSALALHISNTPDVVKGNSQVEQYYTRGLFLSNKAVTDIRTIAHNLLPKDFINMGIFKVLEQRVNELNVISKVNFTLVIDGDEKKLDEVFAITVYRIINELLTNIIKHSMASEASIQLLIEEKSVQVMCEDDGIGFNQQEISRGMGLKNIAGRVEFLKGDINVDSSPNGTTIIIHIPL